MIQTCENCAARSLLHSASIRAEDRAGLNLSGRSEALNTLRLSGGVTLSAHLESATIRDPVTITARDGRRYATTDGGAIWRPR